MLQTIQGARETESVPCLVNSISRRLGGFGLMLHETTTDITAVAEESRRQVVQFKRLRESADLMVEANRKIDNSSEAAQETTRAGQAQLSDCRSAMAEAMKCMSLLVNTTEDIERRLSGVEKALAEVTAVSNAIESVAKQTNLLALNATIEASRAGNAGRGFAVVAAEVKILAGQTREATLHIRSTVDNLSSQIAQLKSDSIRGSSDAHGTYQSALAIENAIGRVGGSLTELFELNKGIKAEATENLRYCIATIDEISSLERGVGSASKNLASANAQVTGTLDKLARLIDEIGTSSVPTDDTPYLEASKAMRTRILDVFERALAGKALTIDELFSEDYAEIPGTNPTQYSAKFSRVCEREFPAILELTKNSLPHIAFAVATDRKGYLPVHNAEHSKPQGKDPDWNEVNCRNKRFFPTQATISGMDFTRPSYLLTRRRDLGNGKHVMLKLAYAPIWVRGRHWGAASVGYVLPQSANDEASIRREAGE